MVASTDQHPLFSLGHSNHSLDLFRNLLSRFQIEALVDVRTHPASRYVPHFNKEALADFLGGLGVTYLFLGRELGGRPDSSELYDDEGYVLYDLLAQEPRFREGLARLERGRQRQRMALMCSEENPAVCHRHLLIGRVLAERGVSYFHIRGDGSLLSDLEVRRTDGKKTDVYQPTLFGDVDKRPWRSLKPLAPKERGTEAPDAMDE